MTVVAFKRASLSLMLALSLTACGGGGGSSSSSSGGSNSGGSTSSSYTPFACTSSVYDTAKNLRIYQVMVESFIDGDSNADYDLAYGPSEHKGDIQGIINSLDYIQSLGMNAIWLTPVFESVAISGQDQWASRLDGTGYYTSNYFAIDPKFGTDTQFKTLVDEAHKRGLYVLMDGVFGHFKNNASNYPSPSGLTLSTNGTAVSGVSGRQAVYPTDLAFFKEVATYWINNYKIDGWRLDQAYQVPTGAWGEIRQAVETAANSVTYTNANGQTVHPLGYMVGEVWDSAANIATNGYGTSAQPGLCSTFDFPMRYNMVQTFAVEESGKGKLPATNLGSGYDSHTAYPSFAEPNGFLSNHDLVRFGDLLQRGSITDTDKTEYWQRHKLAYSFLSAYTGPITLYYGDEVGDQLDNFSTQNTTCAGDGANNKWCDDNAARTPGKVQGLAPVIGEAVFSASSQQADLRSYITSLMTLRANHAALYSGTRTHLSLGDTSVIYADFKQTADKTDTVLYLANTSTSDFGLTVTGSQIGSSGDLVDLLTGTTYSITGGSYTLTVPALTGLFLEVKTPTSTGPAVDTSSLTGTGDLADCTKTTVSDVGPLGAAMYIRGSYSGGGNFANTPSDHQFGYKGNNLYQVVVNESQATSFTMNFADSNWTNQYAVANSAAVVIGSTQTMATAPGTGTESSITIPKAGKYVYSFQVNSALTGGTMMVSLCAN